MPLGADVTVSRVSIQDFDECASEEYNDCSDQVLSSWKSTKFKKLLAKKYFMVQRNNILSLLWIIRIKGNYASNAKYSN